MQKLTLFNKNYICIHIENSNTEYWVLEKNTIFGKQKTPVTDPNSSLYCPRSPKIMYSTDNKSILKLKNNIVSDMQQMRQGNISRGALRNFCLPF